MSHLAAVFPDVNPGKHILIASIGLKKMYFANLFYIVYVIEKMRQVVLGDFKKHHNEIIYVLSHPFWQEVSLERNRKEPEL